MARIGTAQHTTSDARRVDNRDMDAAATALCSTWRVAET